MHHQMKPSNQFINKLMFILVIFFFTAMCLGFMYTTHIYAAQVSDTNQKTLRNEYPRPDWARSEYINLNGSWQFDFDEKNEGLPSKWYDGNHTFNRTINVPFCWESKLSGIDRPNYLGEAWYQKDFSIPDKWNNKSIYLCFGAVDWQCKVWINGKEVGKHTGGYNAFEFDITNYLNRPGQNKLTVWVKDDVRASSDEPALVGKQGYDAPCGYSHTSGIWQTVRLEARNKTFINSAQFASNIDKSQVLTTIKIKSPQNQKMYLVYDFTSKLYNNKTNKNTSTGSKIHQKTVITPGTQKINTTLPVQKAQLWSCDKPVLYEGTLKLFDKNGRQLDKVSTYFGMRKISTDYYGQNHNVKYVFLNNKPIYLSGVLDQGFWENGIYTAPSEDALKQDVLHIKKAGFNYMRKHIKVEDPLQYYWCDKLGLMVMQDIPWGTDMVPKTSNADANGRKYYEDCLVKTIQTEYNHPSMFSLILFNETWGLQDAYTHNNRYVKASDGMNTKQWISYLYKKVKRLDPNILVEDMSACHDDHVQPTDLNSYHMYPKTFSDAKNIITNRNNLAYKGSTNNFGFNNKQDGDPLINSEYGGVAARDGDFDVSYCFKYLTDLQRQQINQSGLLYTEPYDVEYERNGLYTYNRRKKEMGYKKIAYGNDMTTADLVGNTYVGFTDESPIRVVHPGRPMASTIMAIGWTDKLPKKVHMKWRFDATDENGKHFNTGISGGQTMNMTPYQQTKTKIFYFAPLKNCVGTLTVWLEDDHGKKICKNFINIIVDNGKSKNIQRDGTHSLILRKETKHKNMDMITKTGNLQYHFILPKGRSINNIKNLQLRAELSACKTATKANPNTSAYISEYSQTAKGRETPSDITITINGIKIGTKTVKDDPRDMRGTLSLLQPLNGGSSAGDFGYLISMNINQRQLNQIRQTKKHNFTVKFEVKENAVHQNGLKVYSSHYGRYMLCPELLINF